MKGIEVFCGDCKFIVKKHNVCKTPENIFKPKTVFQKYICLPYELNKNDDCKYFVPKWLKILKYKKIIKKWMSDYGKIKN